MQHIRNYIFHSLQHSTFESMIQTALITCLDTGWRGGVTVARSHKFMVASRCCCCCCCCCYCL